METVLQAHVQPIHDKEQLVSCLVPVRRFPSPSRSPRIRGERSGNDRIFEHFRSDHVTQNALAARNNEA